MPKIAAGTVRQDPDSKRIAYKMGDGVTAGAWFILDPDHGGFYTDGEREKVSDWLTLEKVATE